MALVKGTNCGFVTTRPTADPAGTNGIFDVRSWAIRDTVPAGEWRIVEVGAYVEENTQAANMRAGLYSNNVSDDEPEDREQLSSDFAKGTTLGWKAIASLNWALTAGQIKWISMGLDNTATATNTNIAISSGAGYASIADATVPSNWGTSAAKDADGMVAIYALLMPNAVVSDGIVFGESITTSWIIDDGPDGIVFGDSLTGTLVESGVGGITGLGSITNITRIN